MKNAKVNLDKENNEVALGLASDVICTLVLPISGQDRGGRNVTTDNFFMSVNPYPTAFPYGNGMVLHFYQQQESSTTKTVHKVINKGLKAYV